jgi:hypothetical protein
MKTVSLDTGEIALVMTHDEVARLHTAATAFRGKADVFDEVASRLTGTISRSKTHVAEGTAMALVSPEDVLLAVPPVEEDALEVRWS